MSRKMNVAIITVAAAIGVTSGCRRSPSPPAPADVESPKEDPAGDRLADLEAALTPLREERTQERGRSDSWVRVAGVHGGARGGWTTGGFDAGANRISIQTGDVDALVVHLERIPIDWNRRVVLRIDGSTSELRRTTDSLLHLTRSATGGWKRSQP